jgi:hypothetical protein
MKMPNIVALPEDLKGPPAESKTVPPGDYGVRVKKMLVQSQTRITALYKVVDKGEFQGVQVWDTFNLGYERGREMMGEFLAAIGVSHEGGKLDLDLCEGKTLCVSVKHKDGWVNVVSHRPDF